MSPLADALVAWQRTHGRHALPWQNTRDPYRVWLSEIMLQQTQVAAVLRYYARFLERFPDVATLAAAPLDDVLALWSGLGYYSRARNLHRCAQTVVNVHGGVFPPSAAVLAELPGIGRSTAAAIAAFCHEERVSILDGNVKRVLTRVLAFDGDLAQQAQERVLWQHAAALLPADRTDMPAYTQGLMDLGATVCALRQPDCLLCPLSGLCAARASGRMTDYPVRTRKLKRSRRENWCLWLQTADAVWLQQRPDSGIWAGLWSLPLFDDAEALRAAAGAAAARVVALPGFVHVLTHLDWTLHPHRLDLATPEAGVVAAGLGDGRWWPLDQLDRIGLPAPFSRLLLSR
ncbi:A/G-specific adenine glycosylase [Sphaerotilus montanus]|uniref:Adenine DNA glycosylase n=1 Tax=Sphaerotilus montanus TaxID=522889 RepID=A0A7Y9QYL1_9BURK|nr:A/G-specific adenine glycosylase [Sphaerotilus montanus]NYG31940.1 A/G-specific adenine glycosylase [Sphaerotilus montanus]NZD58031.1 A/G-specific adenine glycosylase [Sphaerotilus montanus]